LRRRVSSYFSGRAHDAKTMAMLRVVADVEVTVTRTEAEALMLEYNLIKRHKPRFNVVLRDDKSYPYVYINTEHQYPRLSFYRGSRNRKGRLFGPYPNAGSVRETLSQLQKLFQLRLCEDSYFANRTRPCLQYQIGRCSAPCVGYITPTDYARDIEHAVLFLEGRNEAVTRSLAQRMEEAAERLQFERAAQYRDQIAKLKQVEGTTRVSRSGGDFDAIGLALERGVYGIAVMYFRGGRLLGSRSHFPTAAEGALPEEVLRAFLLQYYYGGHEAPREILVSQAVADSDTMAAMLAAEVGHPVDIKWRLRGDRARWIEMALTNAAHALALKLSAGARMTEQLRALAEVLGMDESPARLECFDVSHTAGEGTVAACVVFGANGPLKSDYRRFNITDVAQGDDYAAMAQALTRRYAKLKKNEAPLPDILLIDGGRGQLKQAETVLEELQLQGVNLVGVAKGPGRRAGHERLYLPGRREPLSLGGTSPAMHLVQQIRDEAHRFAITGHRARRSKRQSRSALEEIRGLGPKRRRALLTEFGGLQALTRAGVAEIARVKGISQNLAESIYEHFHGG
jgi:excinuclease ABC subunit C